jgi:hypothetical protein
MSKLSIIKIVNQIFLVGFCRVVSELEAQSHMRERRLASKLPSFQSRKVFAKGLICLSIKLPQRVEEQLLKNARC